MSSRLLLNDQNGTSHSRCLPNSPFKRVEPQSRLSGFQPHPLLLLYCSTAQPSDLASSSFIAQLACCFLGQTSRAPELCNLSGITCLQWCKSDWREAERRGGLWSAEPQTPHRRSGNRARPPPFAESAGGVGGCAGAGGGAALAYLGRHSSSGGWLQGSLCGPAAAASGGPLRSVGGSPHSAVEQHGEAGEAGMSTQSFSATKLQCPICVRNDVKINMDMLITPHLCTKQLCSSLKTHLYLDHEDK